MEYSNVEEKEAYKSLLKLVKNGFILGCTQVIVRCMMSVRGENKQNQSQIIDFMNRFVLPHEDLLVFFNHKNICHFDEYNNCSHDKTNYGLKSHAAGVLPGHSIDPVLVNGLLTKPH